MKEFYKILNNYYAHYEGLLGRNPMKADMMRNTITLLGINMTKFTFLCILGEFGKAKGVFDKLLNLLKVDKLNPLRKYTADDIQKDFEG